MVADEVSDVLGELMEVQEANPDGLLKAEDVVEYARGEDTALHDKLEWDDSKAGHGYRLWQARQIIRVAVTILPQAENREVRAFVSIQGDRKRQGGGYRPMVSVLQDKALRQSLLMQALGEFRSWRAKYETIKELVPVFEVAEKIEQKHAPKKSGKKALAAVG